jgi:nucleotide-binding universal stress UspA family protein
MYKKILVPVDGSATSTLGLNEAIRIAKCVGGQIRLVHFVNEFVLDYVYGSGGYAMDVIDLLRKGGRSVLERARATVQEQGITPECVLRESMGGRAADLIFTDAAEWGANLIVMGTHGRRGLARVAMGSDAEEVVRSTTVPVLLVRGTPTPRNDEVAAKPLEASAA